MRFIPSIILPPPPSLRTISVGLIILFAFTNTKYIHHSPLLHLLLLPSSPLVLTPRQYVFYFSVLHFLKCIVIVCLGISDMYISCYNQINAIYYFLFLYYLPPILFNSLQCLTLYCLHTQMHCVSILFTLYHVSFPFPLLCSPIRQTH
jgi:hypothetical protein